MSHVPYASAIGSLMYIMVCTMSNLSQTVGMLSRYMHDPGKEHGDAMKWKLWYIKGTVDIGLVFERNTISKQLCMGYIDSDCVGDLDKRQSTMGYVFTLSQASESWCSTLQSTVILSTTIEAEFMALSEAINEAI